jgi:enterobactin synthetase component D
MMSPINLFPADVALVFASAEMWQTPLCAEEEALIDGAVSKRQREFRAGRNAAHEALQRLQAPRQAILRGSRREPLWPSGYLGTIAHCHDLCVAACAIEGGLAGLGIDVEPLSPLPEGVERYIHTDMEASGLEQEELPQRLIFSAKESLYKCYYPLLGRYFGFKSVNLIIDKTTQTFSFEPTVACEIEFPAEMDFHGRFHTSDTHLFTACYLSRN